jgi:hypothetical protein
LTVSDGTSISRDRVSFHVLFPEDSATDFPPVSAISVGPYLGPDVDAPLTRTFPFPASTVSGTTAFSTLDAPIQLFQYGLQEPNGRSLASGQLPPDTVTLPSTDLSGPGFFLQGLGFNIDNRRSSQRYFAFQQPLQYFRPTGFRGSPVGYGLAVADLSATGRNDLVATGIQLVAGGSVRGVFVYRNIAPGRYAQPVFITAGSGGAVTIGDYNGDGRPDIAADAGGSNVDVVFQLGNGDWAQPLRLRSAGTNCNPQFDNYAHALISADFDHDGRLDLAFFATCGLRAISVFFQNGDGTFTERQVPMVDDPGNIFEGTLQGVDVTGDGVPDLVTISPTNSSSPSAHVDVYASMGDRTFAPVVSHAVPGVFSSAHGAGTAGDYDGDGKVDILVAGPDGYYLLRQIPGGLAPAVRVAAFARPTWADVLASDFQFSITEMRLVDIDGDGRADVVFKTGSSGFFPISVRLQQSDGSLAAPRALVATDGFGYASTLPVVFDENGDGFPDLAYLGTHEPDHGGSGVVLVHQRPH